MIGGNNDAAVFRAFCMSNWSITTRAAIDSTIGTARGTTQGSCLPLAANCPGVPSYCAVSCARLIVAGLLNPTLKYISSPFVIPPWTPPHQFVAVPSLPSAFRTNASLCLLPGTSVPRKPDPISKALVAGIESIAWASFASNLSKTGSPMPLGTFLMTQVTVPPIESWEFLARMMRWV